MANTIAIKSSDTAGATPVALAAGELALNRADDELYFLDDQDNIVSIVAIDCGEIVAPLEGWDISTAVFSQNFSVAAQDTAPVDLHFSQNGLKMYVLGSIGDSIYEYDLGVAWDVSTATYYQSASVIAEDDAARGFFIKPDGTRLYVVGESGDSVYQYHMSAPWDISTAAYVQSLSVASQDSQPFGVSFRPDGSEMYVIGDSSNSIHQYSLSTNWDISTATHVQGFSVSSQDTFPTALFFKPDGTRLYVMGSVGDDVNQYDLATAWDISTASYSQNFSVALQETSPFSLFFKPDGRKMYVTGWVGQDINEYDLQA